MGQHRSIFPLPALLVLALSGTLAACSSGNSSGGSPTPTPTPTPTATPTPTPTPVPLAGGRLLYALDNAADTLRVYDETVAANRFTGTTVPAGAGATLVLSNDGLTAALLDGDTLHIVNAGLDHIGDDPRRTEAVRIVSAAPITGVQKVIATTDHFSILKSDGSSVLIEAKDGEEKDEVWTDVVYPTLELAGGQYLIFTANAENAADTDLTVVNADGSSGEQGLIWLRPNVDGFFARSITCAQGVVETAQTERFTIARCGDGTLRWIASGFVTPDSHPLGGGLTIHASQRYPSTETRRAGATGEVPAGGSAFIDNITGLTATRSADNVIVASAANQLWLINLHSDHMHRFSAFSSLPEGTSIIAVASATEDEALTVLSSNAVASTFRYRINDRANPELASDVFVELLGASTATWTADRSLLLGGAFDFYVINRDTGSLYHIDAHEADDEYHLHSTRTDESLRNAGSAVFAHGIADAHDHDHDHDHDH